MYTIKLYGEGCLMSAAEIQHDNKEAFEEKEKIVVDCREAECMHSSLIGFLIMLRKHAMKNNVEFELRLNQNCKTVLQRVCLLDWFTGEER